MNFSGRPHSRISVIVTAVSLLTAAVSAIAPAYAQVPGTVVATGLNSVTPLQLNVLAAGSAEKKFAQQPVIWIVDGDGNLLDTSDSVSVKTLGDGHLTGTTTVVALHGIATFTDLGLIAYSSQELSYTSTYASDSLQHSISQVVDPTASPNDTYWYEVRDTTMSDIANVYQLGCPTSAPGLATVTMPYFNNSGIVVTGTLVISNTLSNDIAEIFHVAFDAKFPFTGVIAADRPDIQLMSMDITSAFSCRRVTGRPSRLSDHSYGLAIDINPQRNPYHTHSRIYPGNHWSEKHRRKGRGVLKSSSLVTKAFLARGWCWGGYWRAKDYQHFEIHTSGCRARSNSLVSVPQMQSGYE